MSETVPPSCCPEGDMDPAKGGSSAGGESPRNENELAGGGLAAYPSHAITGSGVGNSRSNPHKGSGGAIFGPLNFSHILVAILIVAAGVCAAIAFLMK